ncbi:MAG: T9SS type A sorting domain-containing protein, partial [Candidatus Cloacimonetes bacterium]|nr:T9SS type A sorting domain-containing protein [Candidatus Cloacimonadota bacterium]
MKRMFALILCILPIMLFGSKYASMYIVNGAEQTGSPLFLSGTFNNVTGFTTSNNSSEWNLSSNALTNTGGGGLYYVKYSLSYKGTAGLWDTQLFVNGIGYAECDRKINFNQDVGNVSGGCLIQIGNGESINLQVQCDTNVLTFTPTYAQITAVEVNELSTPSYAEIYSTTESTISGIGTSWVNITGYTSGEMSGWSFASNSLTASSSASGMYLALFSMSLSSSSVADLFLGISKNDATPTIVARRYVSGTGDFGSAHTCGIISIAEGDVISLKTRADGSNKSLTPHYSNLVLIPIDGTSQAPYVSMDVHDNTSGVSLSSTWEKEPNQTYSLCDNDNWSFSSGSDDLSPLADSAGKYLLSYNIGITYPNPGESGVDIDVDAGISIGGLVQDKTRVLRTLQKKDQGDFGSASCNGILTIDEASDKIALMLKEHSGLNFSVSVKYSNVTLIRLKEEESFTLPVELCSFYASPLNGNSVEILWETATETDTYGYNVYRDYNAAGLTMTKRNGGIILAQHQTTGNQYSFIDDEIEQYDEYYYWLESSDLDGSSHLFGPFFVEINHDFSNDDEPDIVYYDAVLSNYPNPFNPLTTVTYRLEQKTDVRLRIFNILGKEIYKQTPGIKQKGSYSFTWDASQLASGIYFISL